MTDWLPTLYELAGGNSSTLHVDGYNMWDTLSKGKKSPRQELLHNIHPTGGEAAMRYGQWKIIVNAGRYTLSILISGKMLNEGAGRVTEVIIYGFIIVQKRKIDRYAEIIVNRDSPNGNKTKLEHARKSVLLMQPFQPRQKSEIAFLK